MRALGFSRFFFSLAFRLHLALVEFRRQRVGLLANIFFDLFQTTVDVAQLASLAKHFVAHLILERGSIVRARVVVPSTLPATLPFVRVVIANVRAHVLHALLHARLLLLRHGLFASRLFERRARLLRVGAHERRVSTDIVRRFNPLDSHFIQRRIFLRRFLAER